MNIQLSERQRRVIPFVLLAALLFLLAIEPVIAGTSTGGSNPFSSMITMLTGWLKGGLGLMLALLGLAIGLVAGIGRGSIVGALSGVGIAIAAYWGPDILSGIFGATAVAQHYVTLAIF